jgi:hypothetical protein
MKKAAVFFLLGAAIGCFLPLGKNTPDRLDISQISQTEPNQGGKLPLRKGRSFSLFAPWE